MSNAILVIALLLCSALSVAVNGQEQTREDVINKKLVNDNQTATIIWLETETNQFLGLYNAHQQELAQGAVIIAHQMGAHADWPQIILPIRAALPQYGWSTLSVQLPILPPDRALQNYGKTLPQATQRLIAAVQWLRERQFKKIMIIGHRFGAASALTYLKQQQTDHVQINAIQGLVTIGLQDYAFIRPRIDIFKLIQTANLPILDIYGEHDFKHVMQQATDRRLSAKKNNHYRQVQINGADHDFKGMEAVLIEHIAAWLSKLN